jgi:hypothetical protein
VGPSTGERDGLQLIFALWWVGLGDTQEAHQLLKRAEGKVILPN